MSINILAIDTTTDTCSVAIMVNNRLLINRNIITPRSHAQYILPMINTLLMETELNLNQFDALACCRGPGSFTGIRVGIGIAQGLAFGANIPLIGISTLATLAEGAWRETGINQTLTAIDASMGEIYWAQYQRKTTGEWLGENTETITNPTLLNTSKEIIGCWAVAGSGWKTYPKLIQNNRQLKLISGNNIFPDARDILPIALNNFNNDRLRHVSLVQPVYLRNKICKKNG